MRAPLVLLSTAAGGFLFGVGLLLSGMARADKVLGFLNVGGDWDPSLALVMVGAIGTHCWAYRVVPRLPKPLFADGFRLPDASSVDRRLVAGAVLFGAGWGLGGYCPGPALLSLTTGASEALVFVGAMTLGMGACDAVDALRARQVGAPAPEPSVCG